RSLIPAQGWSAATTLGTKDITELTLKALGLCANNPFRVETNGGLRYPGLSLRANPGLELANAFGVIVGIPACWNLANAFGVIVGTPACWNLANAFGVIVGIPACWNLANAFGVIVGIPACWNLANAFGVIVGIPACWN